MPSVHWGLEGTQGSVNAVKTVLDDLVYEGTCAASAQDVKTEVRLLSAVGWNTSTIITIIDIDCAALRLHSQCNGSSKAAEV